MRAAVTGAAGFVGSHLTEALLSRGDSVLGIDKASGPNLKTALEESGFTFLEGDIRDPEHTMAALGSDVDVIFHLAAVVGVQNYLTSPFDVVDINVTGTRNVLGAAAESGARVVFASTSEIYGRNPKVPWSEDDDRVLGGTQVDRWSYSTSKAAAEHLALAAHRQLGIPLTIVRYFNAYGPRQAPTYVISQSVRLVLRGEPPVLYDGGTQTRCFTFIDDIVAGTIAAGTHDNAIGEVFNLGNSTETTMRDAIEVIIDESGSDVAWEPLTTSEAFGPAYQDITRRIPEVSKAKSVLDWSATTPLREGVRRTLEWARNHPEWLT
ncbi:MAG: NAD-dependent epimerase/dehydratase family protein [Acidimicrobiia bacterium]